MSFAQEVKDFLGAAIAVRKSFNDEHNTQIKGKYYDALIELGKQREASTAAHRAATTKLGYDRLASSNSFRARRIAQHDAENARKLAKDEADRNDPVFRTMFGGTPSTAATPRAPRAIGVDPTYPIDPEYEEDPVVGYANGGLVTPNYDDEVEGRVPKQGIPMAPEMPRPAPAAPREEGVVARRPMPDSYREAPHSVEAPAMQSETPPTETEGHLAKTGTGTKTSGGFDMIAVLKDWYGSVAGDGMPKIKDGVVPEPAVEAVTPEVRPDSNVPTVQPEAAPTVAPVEGPAPMQGIPTNNNVAARDYVPMPPSRPPVNVGAIPDLGSQPVQPSQVSAARRSPSVAPARRQGIPTTAPMPQPQPPGAAAAQPYVDMDTIMESQGSTRPMAYPTTEQQGQPSQPSPQAVTPSPQDNPVAVGVKGIQKFFNLGGQGALPVANERGGGERRLAANEGAASDADVSAARKVVDPQGELTADAQMIAIINAGVKHYMAQGNPDGAAKFAASILMHAKDKTQRLGSLAIVALEKGDVKSALDYLKRAYAYVPDGRTAEGEVQKDGKIKVTIADALSGKKAATMVTPEQVKQMAEKAMTGEQFTQSVIGVAARQPGQMVGNTLPPLDMDKFVRMTPRNQQRVARAYELQEKLKGTGGTGKKGSANSVPKVKDRVENRAAIDAWMDAKDEQGAALRKPMSKAVEPFNNDIRNIAASILNNNNVQPDQAVAAVDGMLDISPDKAYKFAEAGNGTVVAMAPTGHRYVLQPNEYNEIMLLRGKVAKSRAAVNQKAALEQNRVNEKAAIDEAKRRRREQTYPDELNMSP